MSNCVVCVLLIRLYICPFVNVELQIMTIINRIIALLLLVWVGICGLVCIMTCYI